MMAPLVSGEKGASPANSVFVPRWVSPTTLAERASIFLRKVVIASCWGAAPLYIMSPLRDDLTDLWSAHGSLVPGECGCTVPPVRRLTGSGASSETSFYS
ncbi:hypothetical protein LIER_17491 [Lithospermum erythrorhizon]|uniref:Uncharacterized protein n=1 Tax=Lithospermum erythrorhizon TaxID=34254 RepID=A0AAV3QEL8_LITER